MLKIKRQVDENLKFLVSVFFLNCTWQNSARRFNLCNSGIELQPEYQKLGWDIFTLRADIDVQGVFEILVSVAVVSLTLFFIQLLF